MNDRVEQWLQTFVDERQNRRADLPGVTDQRRDYRQKIGTVAESFLASSGRPMTIADLYGTEPRRLLNARRDPRTGASLRPASRNAYRRVLNAFMTWLELRNLNPDSSARLSMEGEGEPTLPVFTAAQIEQIFAHLDARDSVDSRRLAALIALACDVGGRRGDLLSMRLSTLDLDARRATLWVKNDKHIEVPLGALAVIALRRYLEVRIDAGRHDYVFLNAAGTKPITGDSVTRAFRRVLLALGLVRPRADRGTDDVDPEPERLSLHALRRTFVKGYLEAGRDQRELAAIVGWSPEYAHLVVEKYNRVNVDQLQAVHEASSPLNRMLRPAA
jgi:integrase/recombinase XerC